MRGHERTWRHAGATSALPPKADMCGATRDVRFVPIADFGELVGTNRKTASRRSLRDLFFGRHAASAADFFFLRQPSRPKAPRPVAKRGNAAGKGVPAGVAAEPTTLSRPWLISSVSPGMLNLGSR